MSIIHIVMFQFSETATPQEIKAACQRMLSLMHECLHPTTGKPYIKGVSGGQDNSPEGNQGGITHAFVMEFASVQDRDHYVSNDTKHQEFVKSLSGLVAKAQVVDYTPGIF